MIIFIKDYTIKNIKNKLLILYILNVSDIMFTLLLLSTGLYREANTLMVQVVQSTFISFMLKIVLPAMLLAYLYFRMHKATTKQLKICNVLILGVTALYAIVNISHLFWCAMLPVFL